MQSHLLKSVVTIIHALTLATTLSICAPALAQKSPIKTPSPLPLDVTPKVFEGSCGDFVGGYGPIDYRSAHPDDKRLVEKYHFDNEYAAFLRGNNTANTIGSSGLDVGAGFQYVLRVFPNHPSALYAMERLGKRLNTERPPGTQYPLECWYVRAFKITPDDPIVRAMYGIYLANRGRSAEALTHLDKVNDELEDDPNMEYNVGLTYFKLGKYEKAQICAMRAKRHGFRLDGLERMLQKADRWNPQLQLPTVPEVETSNPDTSTTKGAEKKDET